MPLSNKASASGEATALSASAKSRVPASMTFCPGRNLRVAGLGVCSVRISISAMWAPRRLGSRRRRPAPERRRAGDDPASDADRDRKADQRDPPFAAPHRLGPRLEHRTAGDHRLDEMLAAQPVENDRDDVQRDKSKNDVEPQLVNVARRV